MTYQITSTEYVTIDNVPLATPAWIATDLSELNSGSSNRGQSLVIPRRPGALFRNRINEEKVVNIPMIIFGDKSPEGATYANKREGLLTNIGLLKKALFNPYQPNDLSRTLTYYKPDGNVEAVVQTSAELNIEPIGPNTARCVIQIEIPSGTFRATTNTTINQWVDNDETFNIGVPGTAYNYNITYTIPGAANSVIITNNTTGAVLTCNTPITTGLAIYTQPFLAYDGATNVSGSITTTGTPFWLPLAPGTNQLRVQRNGGASVAMSIVFKAAYL
jgi:hypothetical protein